MMINKRVWYLNKISARLRDGLIDEFDEVFENVSLERRVSMLLLIGILDYYSTIESLDEIFKGGVFSETEQDELSEG